ncbi:hypothetical protein CAPTEDRAFT_172665 [Capitella teleta]|uniref:Aminopeptidase P N-terminal domain-containing protein n=1 Tax=Capitella teleta TaxID=283909 RepID=R7T7S9_CAPTE|nr:hypothetical protein CAPTEDRAFT_172665 [Capitella teleta]|eukprot:ELT89493.1 hypothetical protein CAPTEDRAFT_172665 [Capitella teleta]
MQSVERSLHQNQQSDHIIIIPSASKSYMTHDIPFPFRQNTDFLYLSGFLEPNSVLVLEAKSGKLPDHTATLFVPRKDPHRELWDGPRSGKEGTLSLTGVDSAENIDDLELFLQLYANENKGFVLWYNYSKPVHSEFHKKYFADFIKNNRHGVIENPRSLVQSLRLYKSAAEMQLMQKTCDIASAAFVETMKFSRPGVNEAHLYAKMDYECRVNGADILAYPPVVAGGNRANTIHYINNNQIVDDGTMVLMDAGCECHGYTSDITRTWPVSGCFTKEQRALYEAVLDVQKHCLKVCERPGVTLDFIFLEMLRVIAQHLQELNLIPKDLTSHQAQTLARQFCPHHVGHYLGMDVHDTDEISRNIKLQPGMVVTIEPGIYIPLNSRHHVPAGFRGQGIRIEDDVLITSGEPHVLTSACPKNPDHIEKILSER